MLVIHQPSQFSYIDKMKVERKINKIGYLKQVTKFSFHGSQCRNAYIMFTFLLNIRRSF